MIESSLKERTAKLIAEDKHDYEELRLLVQHGTIGEEGDVRDFRKLHARFESARDWINRTATLLHLSESTSKHCMLALLCA
jgi:hypothetical protein